MDQIVLKLNRDALLCLQSAGIKGVATHLVLNFFFFFFLRQYVLMWPNGPGICYVAMGWPQSGSSCVPPTQCWGYKCVPQMPSTLGVSYSMPVGKVPYL